MDALENTKQAQATKKAEQKAKHVDDKLAKYNGRRLGLWIENVRTTPKSSQ